MQQSSHHSARKLPLPVRIALEQLLGRALNDDEAISVRAYQPHEAPTIEEQAAIAEELRHYFAGIDERAMGIPDSKQPEILDEPFEASGPVISQFGEDHARFNSGHSIPRDTQRDRIAAGDD